MKPDFLLFSQARSGSSPTLAPSARLPDEVAPAASDDVPLDPTPPSQALESSLPSDPSLALEAAKAGGWWHFLLESRDGRVRLEAEDFEPRYCGERLELLAVVRGLEALDQPSRVILVTPSRYVQRGLRFGLSPWRDNHWLWERFGELAPVKNADLWQRVDRALEFHRLECRLWRLDHQPASGGRGVVPRPHFQRRRAAALAANSASARERVPEPGRVSGWLATARDAVEQWTAANYRSARPWAAAGH